MEIQNAAAEWPRPRKPETIQKNLFKREGYLGGVGSTFHERGCGVIVRS